MKTETLKETALRYGTTVAEIEIDIEKAQKYLADKQVESISFSEFQERLPLELRECHVLN